MAPKRVTTPKKRKTSAVDQESVGGGGGGLFHGLIFFLVDIGVQPRRLQIWKQKLVQMEGIVEDQFSKRVTHILAMNSKALLQIVGKESLMRFKGSVLLYQWLEESLKLGEKVSEELYSLEAEAEGENESPKSIDHVRIKSEGSQSNDNESSRAQKVRYSPERASVSPAVSKESDGVKTRDGADNSGGDSFDAYNSRLEHSNQSSSDKDVSLPYAPPDLNRNITEIFGKLINIYRALGEDRRSFSYYKAIPVIEKLPFKIESVDQVKHLPTIGKSMQDHIHEIMTTGKLSKLEHFETDEKVWTINLFGEVWGIGPATALKLYEKGHRTLNDLKNEDSLTHSQRVGLEYFEDIKKRIPRDEVQDMELLLQKAAEEVLPGVSVVCGGSFRRGKATCGDMDIVITHPDGTSHKGFLTKYVKHLKDMNFLREDLIFSTHSEEGTDSGVDTYFGLCTYPGRETRHRIDLKVYPRDIYAFGLIAWTGNDVLNRRLRIIAESKGYRLDDTGLFLATHGSDGKKGARASKSLRFHTEKEVFDFLGFPWLEPHERNL
ncbi:hypothetical protein MKX01_038101 [Papaver californicum]|nr:hypothetical protein MKX01_038101 [Papaver californicum]